MRWRNRCKAMRKIVLINGSRKINKRSVITAAILLLVCGVCACGSDGTVQEAPAEEEISAEQPESEEDMSVKQAEAEEIPTDLAKTEEDDGLSNQVSDEDVPQYEGYDLLWHDEFNGTMMDESIWSYEPHAPGWTNAELQEYTTSTENVYVRNGKMTIKAVKTQNDKGKDYYTSGKVTTKGKQDFLYGKVVASAKVPQGKGLWPAIWMMPTNQSYYGGWPRCGEIDIMEVLGDDVNTAYSTIHYGKPHNEQQGKYVLTGDGFADGFHEYSVEWEPGEMRFYIDENLILTVNDWFSGDVGIDDRPYPAPFDQTFYVQLNLAVGGTWPGNPDDSTDFDKAEFEIDYVRVYQKESYDTNVTKPEKVYREALEDGNYIYNGDFAVAEDLDDDTDWSFFLAQGGVGEAVIEDGMIAINTKSAGTVDYSLQLVQPELPMIKGNEYRLTFEAYAEEKRTMNVCVSAPTAGWIRYLSDTPVELTTDWQTYTYEFKMKDRDDNNGRLEFNLGNMGSVGTVYIKNVRVEQIK